jgi:hypothetical protein
MDFMLFDGFIYLVSGIEYLSTGRLAFVFEIESHEAALFSNPIVFELLWA